MKTNECTLFIEGIDCPNCAAKIERKLNTLERIPWKKGYCGV